MENDSDKSKRKGNPFLIPTIIQHLASPNINPDKFTLRNLRNISKFHYQILNPKYLDAVHMNIIINKSKDKIWSSPGPSPVKPPMQLLEPKIWDPITFAPTIRGLILRGNQLDYLLSKSTRSNKIGGLNPLDLISKISPYVTTLSLELEDKHIFEAVKVDFLQQFVNLKILKLQTGKEWILSDLDQFEIFLMKIDNEALRELEIELEIEDVRFLAIMLSPQRKFKTKNHKLSLNILCNPVLARNAEVNTLGDWTRILTMASNNSIPVKIFGISICAFGMSMSSAAEKIQFMNDLSIISPHVEELTVMMTFREMDNSLFISCNWPRLKKVTISSRTVHLNGFSLTCPKLEELNLHIVESKSIFTNTKLTDEENLKQIFGDCTLKILRFKQTGQYFHLESGEVPKIIPGSKLLQYLQELLPNTSIEAEKFYLRGYPESGESSSESE